MLSINTNLSSLITQRSMKSATNLLNQAVERMSTGYKVNHAKDNAAAYSIITNMDTKINAYQVAEDNVAMGMDLVTTVMDMVANMQEKGTRLRDLSIQARNGSYGAQSLAAINSEAAALMAEINRIYNIADYNGISLFKRKAFEIAPHLQEVAQLEYGKFMDNPVTYTDAQLEAMLASGDIVALDNNVTSFTSGKKYLISDKAQLERFATLVNMDKTAEGATIILGADIDLKNEEWTPISDDSVNFFQGSFDGNGHVIKNLKIDSTEDYRGFFGCVGYNSGIKNLGIEGGSVKGGDCVGGLVGDGGKITNCYSTCNVNGGGDRVGGLVGVTDSTITNCYATGDVNGGGDAVGGLVGYTPSTIINSYATGDVNGTGDWVGGLVGQADSTVSNCYATGDVIGNGLCTGGLVGVALASIENSYSTGDVTGYFGVGGLAGGLFNRTGGPITVSGCASYSKVSSLDTLTTGSFIGGISFLPGAVDLSKITVTNCEALPQELNTIAGVAEYDGTSFTIANVDMTAVLAGVKLAEKQDVMTTLQVGVNANSTSRLNFNTNFSFDLSAISTDIKSDESLSAIDAFLAQLNEQETTLGAMQNRLESALDEISTQYENLVSSRSTLRDADMSEVSSQYIQQQILQQASATLMATANQMPSIALQLI